MEFLLSSLLTVGKVILGAIALYVLITKIIGIRIIPNDKVGIVEKWWSPKGSLKEQLIALNGEAGFQPEVLRGGVYFKPPFMYKVHIRPLVTIPQGQIGYVFARDGEPLEPTQTLGKVVRESNNFQDVRAFLQNGGQKGPQRGIIREGVYAFNLAQFVIITKERTHCLSMSKEEDDLLKQMTRQVESRNSFEPIIIEGSRDRVGIVTVHDGPSLPQGDIIAPAVGNDPMDNETYHNNFQDPEKFLKAGGLRGRQYQVLVDGTYFINRLFASVELIDKTEVEVGWAGVVVSYYGPKGQDSSGESYKHGELVENGCRGVWKEPLMPGKYAFNDYAGKIQKVPTKNFVLQWASSISEEHSYDANLKEVGLITKDAFELSLPLSVVLYIPYMNAPMVIQRFGDIKTLIEQTVDPMVSAYFKNIGQTKTMIELLQERHAIGNDATKEMGEKFAQYNLELKEVLIGTPAPVGKDDENVKLMLDQLRQRQIAIEKVRTYEQQELAAKKQKELKEAEAIAQQQTILTESEINIKVQTNQGEADLQKSRKEAEKIQVLAKADSKKEALLGMGKAIATKEQVKAFGGPQYQVAQQIAEIFKGAITDGKVDIVPKTLINMSGESGNSGNALIALMSVLLGEKFGVNFANQPTSDEEDSPEVKKIKEELQESLSASDSDSSKEIAKADAVRVEANREEDKE